MSKVYGGSDGSVHEWRRKFKEGQTDDHEEGGQGLKSVTTEGIFQQSDQVETNEGSPSMNFLKNFQTL